jgi:hypothetical protein
VFDPQLGHGRLPGAISPSLSLWRRSGVDWNLNLWSWLVFLDPEGPESNWKLKLWSLGDDKLSSRLVVTKYDGEYFPRG